MVIGGLERVAYGAGLTLLSIWLIATIPARLLARQSITAFDSPVMVDQSEWSAQRISSYAVSLGTPTARPLAILRIPRLKLAVPVLEGTDDRILDRGVGHIAETPRPGEDGNVGIAGHRDGFFRGLKDIRTGDTIELATRDGDETYVVERTWIVEPDDISVLEPTDGPAITLVTCYPFYYVGSAPKRFIVRAMGR